MAKVPRKPLPQRRRHFIREWRQFRGLTLEKLAEKIGVTHGALSQLELYRTSYTEPMLNALADALMCEPDDLLRRRPGDSDELMQIIAGATPEDRATIAEIAKTIIRRR